MLTSSANLTTQFTPCQTASSNARQASFESSDAGLIERVAAGEKAAMQTLYRRHHVKVYRFALRLVGDETVAEDVASETFLDVWRQAGTFKGGCQVSTWLLSIARNKALSTHRRGSVEVSDDAAAASIADLADDPAISLQHRQQRSILFNCLKSLSPAHREIINLVYYQQKEISEVAEIIRISRSTVKTRMFYARRKLAELLGGHGITTALS